VQYVVLYDVDGAPAARPRMLADAGEWSLLYADGRTSIHGWREAPQGSPFLSTTQQWPEQAAFGEWHVAAPVVGPNRGPVRPDLWDQFRRGPDPLPLEADGAGFYLEQFAIVSERWPAAMPIAPWAADWGAIAGLTSAAPGIVPAVNGLALTRYRAFSPFLPVVGAGPPAPLLASIRLARQALARHPDDLKAHLVLAQAYQHLWYDLEGRWTSNRTQRPQQLRQVQLSTALRNSLTLRPDSPQIHHLLRQYYFRINYLDLALEHLNEEYRLTRSGGRRPGMTLEQVQQQLDELQKLIKEVDTLVQRSRNEFEVEAANQPLNFKTQRAMERGLAKRALELLQQADAAQKAHAEVDLQVLLLLTTGQADEVRGGLEPALKPLLGANYEWYHTLLAAASGDYRSAGEYVEQILELSRPGLPQAALFLSDFPVFRGQTKPDSLFLGVNSLLSAARNLAALHTVRGILALEQGDNEAAAKSFRDALQVGRAPGEKGPSDMTFDGRPIAVRYLRLIEAMVP
jgi:tetratricopeptide (TPR) repeat protein